jgi:hypothetical protein
MRTEQVVRWARRRGWSVGRTARGHLRLTRDGAPGPIFGSGTPSDWRAVRNLQAAVRRAERGLQSHPERRPTP